MRGYDMGQFRPERRGAAESTRRLRTVPPRAARPDWDRARHARSFDGHDLHWRGTQSWRAPLIAALVVAAVTVGLAAAVAAGVKGRWGAAEPSATATAPAVMHLSPPPATPTVAIQSPDLAPAGVATVSPAQMATPVDGGTPAAGISRLVIPSIGVDAPVVVMGLDENQVMEDPTTPEAVAWYDFTSRPGETGNAVFSGHLDFAGVGPAVFWRLRDVQEGDDVDVVMDSGTVYRYRVVSKVLYREATAPVAEIIGPTPVETVTLITCGGEFNYSTGRYDDRLIVRAERVPA